MFIFKDKVFYLNAYLYHHKFLISKHYLNEYVSDISEDKCYHLNTILNEYLNKGYIRVSIGDIKKEINITCAKQLSISEKEQIYTSINKIMLNIKSFCIENPLLQK